MLKKKTLYVCLSITSCTAAKKKEQISIGSQTKIYTV